MPLKGLSSKHLRYIQHTFNDTTMTESNEN
jgi:hypothetical protein